MSIHDKTRTPRPGKLIVVSLVSISLILAILWVYFQLWNVPTHSPTTTRQTNKSPIVPQWRPIFEEEFNGTSLDTTKWNIQDTSEGGYQNCCLSYGLQYFTPESLSFSNGALRITTQKQTIGDYSYTSGAITTENKFTFVYGRVDVRVKFPTTKGFWPAIWLLPKNTVGTAPFEIDIAEVLGDHPTTVHMANHWGKDLEQKDFTGPNFAQEFHVLSVTWTRQAVTWYIDGIQRFESKKGISDQPMYLIINSTIGGDWPGNPDASTVLPQHMDIDYVRVYKSASDDATPTP